MIRQVTTAQFSIVRTVSCTMMMASLHVRVMIIATTSMQMTVRFHPIIVVNVIQLEQLVLVASLGTDHRAIQEGSYIPCIIAVIWPAQISTMLKNGAIHDHPATQHELPEKGQVTTIVVVD